MGSFVGQAGAFVAAPGGAPVAASLRHGRSSSSRAPPPPRVAALAPQRATGASPSSVTPGSFVGRSSVPVATWRWSSTAPRRARRGATPPTMIRGGGDRGGGGGEPVPVLERIGASAPYLLPLLDGLVFGRFVFERAPTVAAVVLPAIAPLFRAYRGIPFFAFGIFFALYLLVVRNTGFSRFVRFNTQQALLLDVVLILPQLLGGAVAAAGVPGWLLEAGSSTIFYAVVVSVGYAVVSNARGEVPDQIPAVSEAVEAQIGPY
ncbi:hypothetical protein I4F81_004606 [Pyropia yezoensis]|uniref:Uncharacterized protein n=1 Tax=Pyropia yezoensis TaxID=2788 RepID=A0ACC3BVX1_PYRYE|nr:hypothetical protein I4F81_004606 [Neopyropia yezoensis]